MKVARAPAGVATFRFHRFFASAKLNPPPSQQPSFPIETSSAEESVDPPGHENSEVAKVESRSKILKQGILARVNRRLSEGVLPPSFVYLTDLGFDLEEIKKMTISSPTLAGSSVERKLKPLVKFLLDFGMSQNQVCSALRKCPRLCTCSIEENLRPTVAYLESLGIDKSRWEKILSIHPDVFSHGRQKMRAVADYISGLGVPPERLGKMLTYHPQLFGCSIESKIKPTTQFLLDKGFTNAEVATMVSRFGSIYSLNLERNLIPKWEFFLQMGCPQSEIVKFPQYFGYSLEGRIKPRFNLVREYGIPFRLHRFLLLSDEELKTILMKHKSGTGS